jgi:hypothetical protein
MKSMDGITKRLNEVEKKSRKGTEVSYQFEYASSATGLAQTLTGMAIQTPERWEITWGRGNQLPPASDAFKIRWLRQYTPAQIDEIRREWEESTFERDKVALRELVRLQAETSEHSLVEKQAEDQ